jgi:oligopeptide transport system permease protein
VTRLPPTRLAAYAGLALLFALAIAGPRAGTMVTGYGADEQHTTFPFAPPGFRDVPAADPAFDGDPAAFALLDGDRDGRLAWVADPDGTPRSPELAPAAAAWRGLSLDLSGAWGAQGRDGRGVPGALVRAALGGNDAWIATVLTACDDDACPIEPLVESSRFLRMTPAHLAALDANGDGAVDAGEFRGAPRTSPHLLGTDDLGRDTAVRLLDGIRMSLAVGLVAALAASIIGIAWGATAALAGGAVESVMMRLVDVIYGLPFLFIVILVISLVGPSTLNVLLAIAGVQWLTMARTVRALVKSLRSAPYIEAAEVMGCGPVRLVATHLVPNARRPILAWAALLVPAAIKEEAFLSFLGLGVQAPRASLGTLIADGAGRLAESPWLVAAPAAVLFLLVLCITVAADEAR